MSSPLQPPTPGDCHRLRHPDGVTVAFAAFITVGILASYLPQHHKIIARGSSSGLSPYWVLLGGLSSIAAIGNIMVLPASRADMKCCKDIGLGSCVAALLGVAQIGTQFCCFMLMCVYLCSSINSSAQRMAINNFTQCPPFSDLLCTPPRTEALRQTLIRNRIRPITSCTKRRRRSRQYNTCRSILRQLHQSRNARRLATPHTEMGQRTGCDSWSTSGDSISAPDLLHMEGERCEELIDSHNAHTSTRSILLRVESLVKSWKRGLERLGCLHCYGLLAVGSTGHGDRFLSTRKHIRLIQT